jgi:dihydrodipicolinate synthase/N-acetylneuraminate lyase
MSNNPVLSRPGPSSELAGGVYAALAMPRRRDSIEADAGVFLEYLDRVHAGGVDGFVFFGSTGEFVHFDVEERMRVVTLGVKRSRIPVLVNVSHSSLCGTRDLADHAIDNGVAGLLIMPPYFYRYDDAEIERFFDEIAEEVETRVPLYLYNLPFFTTPIPPTVMERLLTTGIFAGIKDSSGEWSKFEFLRELRERRRFQLLVGNESIYVRGLLEGADGTVSGIAAAIPELPVAVNRASRSGDAAAARRLGLLLDEFTGWINRFPATVAIKQAAEVRGWLHNELAVPLGNDLLEELSHFREWLTGWLPETLSACAAVAAGE